MSKETQKFIIRDNGRGESSDAKRDAASVAHKAEQETLAALKLKRDIIYRAMIAAHPEYMEASKAVDASRRRMEKLASESCYYRFHAGNEVGIGFWVKGSGDSRVEAIEKAKLAR
jgi:hypothetical protein